MQKSAWRMWRTSNLTLKHLFNCQIKLNVTESLLHLLICTSPYMNREARVSPIDVKEPEEGWNNDMMQSGHFLLHWYACMHVMCNAAHFHLLLDCFTVHYIHYAACIYRSTVGIFVYSLHNFIIRNICGILIEIWPLYTEEVYLCLCWDECLLVVY